MEIKVLIFIAFLLISVISSVIKGLRKFNENRPGRQGPPPERTEPIPDAEEIFREIQKSFRAEKKEMPVEEPAMPESVIVPEVADAAEKRRARIRKSAVEMKQESRTARKKTETPTVSVSKIDDVSELTSDTGIELPDSVDDFRKMIVWSAILNRPYA